MFRLEPRASAPLIWQLATPVLAVLATMLVGGLLFAALGFDPVAAIRTIFWDPLFGPAASYSRPQLLVKAGPLILIACGLALGFRAGIWNIGAEGQYIIGAICGAAAAIRQALLDLAGNEAAVIVISQDLDELLELSDRFCALNEGRLSAPRPTEGLTIEEIGLMLGGAHGMEVAHVPA